MVTKCQSWTAGTMRWEGVEGVVRGARQTHALNKLRSTVAVGLPSLSSSAAGAGAGAALTMVAASLGEIFCEPVVVALSVTLLSHLPSTRFCHCWRVSSMIWRANA